MRRIIYIIAMGAIMTSSLWAQSQDSLLTRQMELDRNFNPTLLESNKINSLPTLREPVVQKANTNYSTWNVNATPPLEIAIPRAGTINTQIPYSKERGYIYLSGGNYANIDGVVGYRILDKEQDKLAFNFFHNSTNGNINYIQTIGEDKTKANVMNNMGEIKYNHYFEKIVLNTHASYLHSMYNYYGNTMGDLPQLDGNNQQVGIFNLNLGIDPTKNSQFEYRGFVDFKYFTNKYAQSFIDDPLKGNQIEAMVGFKKPYGTNDGGFGIDGNILNANYSNKDLKNYLLVAAKPYVDFRGDNWQAKLGADVLFHILGKTQIRVVPNVQLKYAPVYLNIKGGYDSNTFIDMFEESRYVLPNSIVTPSFSIVDIEGGVEITNLKGFRFDVFGGFKQTTDEHFLVMQKDAESGLTREFLTPLYNDLLHSHIGARIQSTIWSPLNVALSLKKNFYTMKDSNDNGSMEGAKAWNKPGFEADVRAELSIIEGLKLTLNYYLATDRWTYYDDSNVKMDNINDLNLGAVYQISNSFAVNLKANNILAQKYDIWYGHPAQGMNVMGGFSFKF